LHKVLEEATDESESALNSAVESKWHTLDFESEWVERSQRKKAREMVSWLAGSLADKKADKIEAIAKEQKIKAEIGQAKISGNIDRIERSASGEIVIADLKTGASAPSQTSMDSENAQLALYQLAFEHGGALAIPGYQDGDRLVGATLIFPGAKKVLTQSSLNAEANPALQAMWLEKVQVAVRGMAMSDGFFLANIDSHCHDDNSYGDCKLFLTEAVSHAG
jgi:RecB family exonuclease